MNVTATLGASVLITALASSSFATLSAIYGLQKQNNRAILASQRAIVATGALTTLALFSLAFALLSNDFSISHVAEVSSTNMQPWMKWASLYSGQPGSLLFWTWSMSLLMTLFAKTTLRRMPWGTAHAIAAMGIILTAFLIALVFFASPFRINPVTPVDGQGLNPLLVDPGMLIHPPMLLTGLVSTSIPFVIGVSALASGRVDTAWLRHARLWALASFVILSAGNFLGAWWAYTVLGWGGYWGWDPVENSAILPLLPITAFLHSAVVQERRGMLKGWNLALILTAFALAIFGTFNVRSGLVASVHSFAQSEVGPYFLVLLALVVATSLALAIWRMPLLRADHDFDSFASRETGLIVNTYVLTVITLVILGGTLFPIFSELVNDTRITVGPPFFNDTTGPLWIGLLLLMSVGTILPWRRASPSTVRKRFRSPLAMLLAIIFALTIFGMRNPYAIATIAAAAIVIFVTTREFYLGLLHTHRSGKSNWLSAIPKLFERDRQRYGGYLVHLGAAVIAISIISSSVFETQVRATLAPGETINVGKYQLTYDGLRVRKPDVNGIEQEVVAIIDVEKNDTVIASLQPGQRFFSNFASQPVAIVAIDGNLLRDLYVFMQGFEPNQTAEIQAFIKPLIQWLWIGGAIYILGGLLAFTPIRQEARVRDKTDAPENSLQE